ncbi:cytosine permease [Mycolicibacterium sp. YH-1]|uniref:purine-cytosine permease family protein n=1 Tax=Mycolicibacterium sp. YH-1 TaxID=2908837 RepID=UPI001F4C3624|nr:cytosine permease [Mycolicibacterium sp. YH-1]UNB50808.1 cytosine permease [Mycolicibacterium sp. YH-1]
MTSGADCTIVDKQAPIDNDSERVVSYVPAEERHGTIAQQFRFWFLSNFQFYAMSIGFIGPSMGLNFGWSVLATLLGLVIGTTFMALHGSQGPHLGLPQMIQSRAQFGHRGVVVPILSAVFVFVASSIMVVVIASDGIEKVFGIPAFVGGWLITGIAMVMALSGYDWLHRIYTAVLYLSLPFIIILTIALPFQTNDIGASSALGFTAIGFIFQATAAAGYNITLAPYVSDYTRYMRSNTSSKKMVLAVGGGAAMSGLWMMGVGSWLASYLGVGDALSGMRNVGNGVVSHLGDLAALTSVIALIAANATSAYSTMLSAVTVRSSFGRPIFTGRSRIVTIILVCVFVGVVGTSITGDVLTALGNALTLNLAVLVPWTAINLVDYFLLKRGRFIIADLLRPSTSYGMWSARGLTAYAIGIAFMAPFLVVHGFYEGPLAKVVHGADISWALGLIVSALAYVLLQPLDRLQGRAPSVADAEPDVMVRPSDSSP